MPLIFHSFRTILAVVAAIGLVVSLFILFSRSSEETAPEVSVVMETEKAEDSGYVVTFEAPNGEMQTYRYKATPEQVTANAAKVSPQSLPPISLPVYDAAFGDIFNAQLSLIAELEGILQKDLPLKMLELQNYVVAGDFQRVVSEVDNARAIVTRAQTINAQVRDKTDQIAGYLQKDGDSLKPSVYKALVDYVDKSTTLSDTIAWFLDWYDTILSPQRVESMQLPSQSEIEEAERRAESVSTIVSRHALSLKTLLSIWYGL